MTSPLDSTPDPINPYASPLAEDAAFARERTRWRIVAVVVASVCAAVVGIGVYLMMSLLGLGVKLLGASAGQGPLLLVHLGMASACAIAAFIFSINRSRRAWDQYEGLLERKRQMLEEARERRDAKNAPPASPFADRPQ
jgi:uncharacterized membrane protein YccC